MTPPCAGEFEPLRQGYSRYGLASGLYINRRILFRLCGQLILDTSIFHAPLAPVAGEVTDVYPILEGSHKPNRWLGLRGPDRQSTIGSGLITRHGRRP